MDASEYLYEIKTRKAGQPDLTEAPYAPMFIYVLVDPRTDKIRYVGATDTPAKRLAQHRVICPNVEFRCFRDVWIAELLAEGLQPRMFIVDETYRMHAAESETWYIQYYVSLGCDLVNGRNHRGYRARLN